MTTLSCKYSILRKPDGSVEYVQGETKVLVAVYGPADCKESAQVIDKATVVVNFRPKFGIPGVSERFYEKIIQTISETTLLTHMHPRTQINITIQVIQDAGSNASLAMKFLPIAISQIISEEETVVYMPSKKDEENFKSELLFVFDSTINEIICSNVKGKLNVETYKNCIEEATLESKNILKFFKQSIAKMYS